MASRQDLLTATQNIVNAVNLVAQKLNAVFPQAAGLSSSAPAAGAVVFTSSQAASFLSVTTSSGGIYRIPLY